MNDPVVAPQPRQFARYSITRELRRERATVVYLALDPVMHREVILKVVQLPPHSDSPHGEAQASPLEQAFVRQAQAAGKLNHPHIVTVYEAGRLRDQGFLAIERVNGRGLHDLIASGWRPQFVHAASIAARIADAIEHAHSQDVAHGHLGPQHVLLQTDGVPKVEGFGGWIDTGAGSEDALHRTEKLLPYFHNELTEEMRHRDVRAVAALVYMMLVGRAPADPPAKVASVRAEVPAALARLVDETLDPPAGRAQRSAGDLRDALTSFIWNERKENVAPATIGIPLAAPPRSAPGSPSDPHADMPATAPRGAPPVVTAAITRTVEPGRPATVRSPATLPERGATAVTAPAEPAPGLAGLVAQARPWLQNNRLYVGAAAGFVFAAVVLAMVLATFAGSGSTPGRPAIAVPGTPAAPTGEGVVRLDITPWGEVVVDGKPTGVSPPMTELRLPAGKHSIEIRYGDKAAVSAQVDVDPAKPLQIRHRFE